MKLVDDIFDYDPYKGWNPLTNRLWPLGDRTFGRLFGGQDDISEQARNPFLSDLLGRKVVHSVVQKTVIEEDIDAQKRPVADFICTLEDGSVVAIEVQKETGDDDLAKRLLFYLSRIYGWPLGKGGRYASLMPVYQVVILVGGTLFPSGDRCVSWAEMRRRDGVPYPADDFHLVTIEMRKLERDKTVPCHLRDWLVYFKEGWKDAEATRRLALRTKGIAVAEEVCMALARDMSYLEKVRQDMHERDRAIALADEKRAEAIVRESERKAKASIRENERKAKASIRENEKKAKASIRENERKAKLEMEEAMRKSLQEGKKVGVDLGKQQVARNLKSMGMTVSEIVQACGLSEEEIEKL
jgi:predicted transposase/invertase (TIGR01784 family)